MIFVNLLVHYLLLFVRDIDAAAQIGERYFYMKDVQDINFQSVLDRCPKFTMSPEVKLALERHYSAEISPAEWKRWIRPRLTEDEGLELEKYYNIEAKLHKWIEKRFTSDQKSALEEYYSEKVSLPEWMQSILTTDEKPRPKDIHSENPTFSELSIPGLAADEIPDFEHYFSGTSKLPVRTELHMPSYQESALVKLKSEQVSLSKSIQPPLTTEEKSWLEEYYSNKAKQREWIEKRLTSDQKLALEKHIFKERLLPKWIELPFIEVQEDYSSLRINPLRVNAVSVSNTSKYRSYTVETRHF